MKDHESAFPIAGADVATVYQMFACGDPDLQGVAPTHAEFLIDRQGYIRARWAGLTDAMTNGAPEFLGQVKLLEQEPGRPRAPEGHVH